MSTRPAVPSLDEIMARGQASLIPLEWALAHMGEWHGRTARDLIRSEQFPLKGIRTKPGRGGVHYVVPVRSLVEFLCGDEEDTQLAS